MAAQTTAPALTPAQAVNVFSAFLKARCVDELVAVMLERELNAHYGVKIECAPVFSILRASGTR